MTWIRGSLDLGCGRVLIVEDLRSAVVVGRDVAITFVDGAMMDDGDYNDDHHYSEEVEEVHYYSNIAVVVNNAVEEVDTNHDHSQHQVVDDVAVEEDD